MALFLQTLSGSADNVGYIKPFYIWVFIFYFLFFVWGLFHCSSCFCFGYNDADLLLETFIFTVPCV